MISKKITETVTVNRTMYIAEDGTEFEEYRACELHEENLLRAKQEEALQSIEHKEAMDQISPLDGGEYYESHDYRWFKPKNMEEINLLNTFFGIEFDPLVESDIGEWICVENYDISRMDEPSWVSRLKGNIQHIKWFLEQFGYEISIKESEQK